MLWPEGSPAVLCDIGTYLDPQLPDEKTVAFSVSKMGSYIAVASKRVLAMFRIRPLTPLAIYVDLFPDKEIIDVASSASGSYIAVLTNDNRVACFAVKPRHDIEEVFKITYSFTPGPGEEIGARELWLEPVSSIYTEDRGLALDSVGSQLIIYTEHEVQYGHWLEFESTDPLKPPHLSKHKFDGDTIVSGHSVSVTKAEWICFVVTAKGDVKSFRSQMEHLNSEDPVAGSESGAAEKGPERLEVNGDTTSVGTPGDKNGEFADAPGDSLGPVACIDYSYRMKRLAVALQDGRIFIYSKTGPLELTTESHLTNPLTMKWTPSGTALLVGYKDGYQLLSMLGLHLYSSSEVGVVRADWMLSAEAVLLLCTDGKLRLQNMLRWAGRASSERERPVLHGNGRLMLYYDPSSRGITAIEGPSNQSWLTVPLPTWYLAQNWPIVHICCSPDGRYVAIAGTAGIMMFNVTTRQWKEIGSNDALVRGGMCWYGRHLLAATVSPDTGIVSLQMFSPMTPHGSLSTRSSSANLLKNLWSQRTRPSGEGQRTSSQALASPENSVDSQHPPAQSSGPLRQPPDAAPSSNNLAASPNRRHSSVSFSPTSAVTPATMSTFPSVSNISALGSMAEQQIVASDVLGKGPTNVVGLMSVGSNGLLGVLTGVESQHLLIYDLDRQEFELVHDLPLSNVLSATPSTPAVRAFTILSERRILVLIGTTLMLVSTVDEDYRQYQRQVVAEPIETYEYVAKDQQLWVFDGQASIATNFAPDGATENKFVAAIPLDAYPVHYSTYRGVLALVECEPVRSFDSSFSVAKVTCSHEIVIQYVLEAALLPAFSTAVSIARRYAKAPYFAGLLESLLHHVVTGDSKESRESINAAIELLREFPNTNFEAIVAGCARKVEMKYWARLFEAIGKTPAELFDICLERYDLEIANEFLIVVQASTETPADEATENFDLDGRIYALYRAAAEKKQFWICKQVCEFVMALDSTGKTLEKFYDQLKST